MQSKRIDDLLESKDTTNHEIALKILKEQMTKTNCIAIVYKSKTIGHKYQNNDSIQKIVAEIMDCAREHTGFKIDKSISKSTKDIYNYLRNNDVDDDSINAFLKYYMDFIKYSITLDTSFDYIPPANLNLFDND